MIQKADGYRDHNDRAACICGSLRTDIASRAHYVGEFDTLVWSSYYYRCPDCQTLSGLNLHFEPASYTLTPIEHYCITDSKRRLNAERVAFIRSRAAIADDATIFYLGSGEGAFTEAVRLALPASRIHAVEADDRMPAKFTAEYEGAQLERAYIEDFLTRTEDSTADLILLTDVLEHVLDPDALLAMIARTLKPGGVAYITAPNSLSLSAKPVSHVDWERANFTCQHLWVMEPAAMAGLMARHFDVIVEDHDFESAIRQDGRYSTFVVRKRGSAMSIHSDRNRRPALPPVPLRGRLQRWISLLAAAYREFRARRTTSGLRP